jgi:uncharacterized protein
VSQVLDLLTLQALDDEAAALHASLGEVERRLHGDEALNAARAAFARAEEALAALQKQQRQLDAEIQGLTAKIEPEEKRLYGGSVKNPKELQGIQHEVELLKEQRARVEDRLLEVLAEVEGAEAERSRALGEVEGREMRRSTEVEALRQEASRLTDGITRAEARRMGQQAKVDPRTLALYEDLRRRKGGHAVARVQGNACSGCRVQLPDAVRRRAMSPAQLAQCPNCERILAVG